MSPVTQSAVDLRVPGPVNPEEPSPVNPELDVPVLTSFTGNANQLTGADANQPASVAFALYDPAVADEVIRLYYGPGQGVAATHTLTTESPGDIITMALPWPIIQAVGNGLEIELYYRIFATADSENFQQSGSQLVRSEVIQLADLRLAEIVGVTGNNVVCSDQPWNGLNVLVVDRDHLEAGDNVVLHFSMINLGDTDPVEGTEVDLAANVSDPNQGVNIPLLWDYIRPAGNRARMLLAWSVFRGGIAVGRSEVKQYNYNVSVGTGNCIPGGGTAGQRVARLG